MPLLRREPEIFPEDLFGPPPGDEDAAGAAPAAAPVKPAAWPSGEGRLWWVAYVRSRQEKAFARHLLQWEVAYYLPQREHRLRAGGRWRTSYLPLFTGYVFFCGDLRARVTAKKSNLVVHLIDGPADGTLEQQLRSLWLLQTTGAPLVSHPYLAPGDEVEVMEGALRGYRGKILREKGKYRLIVSIELLRQSVMAELPREVLAPARLRKVG